MLSPLSSLAAVILLGGAAQWIAWRLRLPSILLLLPIGVLAGPVSGLINPDALFGPILLPIVALSVAMILFEGGLTLNFRDIRDSHRVVWNLVSIGVLITWALAGLAAHFILGLPPALAALFGAILTVTGPTVVGPLLQQVRPTGPAAGILRWEGIVVDPIGALLAVLVFEVLISGGAGFAFAPIATSLGKTVLVGGGLGLLAALFLQSAIARYWIPDHLHNAVTLLLVAGIFAASNAAAHEGGLLAVTVMGIALANQRRVNVHHILEFKENLRVFLISAMFILLAARINLADLAEVGWRGAAFVLVLVVIVRPLASFASAAGSRLSLRDRIFVACVAPRGIVAAAVTSVFAFELDRSGAFPEARLLVPMMFSVIVGTVLIYGLCAGPIARRLRLAESSPAGLLLIGAQRAVREIAFALHTRQIPVILLDTNRVNVSQAHAMGLSAITGSVLDDTSLAEVNLAGIGRALALTQNDEVNLLAVTRLAGVFGRAGVYRAAPRTEAGGAIGRVLFSRERSAARIERLLDEGQRVVELSAAEFTERARGPNPPTPLFYLMSGRAIPVAVDEPTPRGEYRVLALAAVAADAPGAAQPAAGASRSGNGAWAS
ncbi:MAG: sodium:proton antiporter [Planctomycetia bacterium]|nr:MAG: sodium:proton antiporter [Planctomycetia bacterium]